MFSQSIAMVMLLAAAPAAGAAPQLGQPLELKPTEVVTVEGVRITFEGVTEDSRCPTGTQCAWAGDAAAAFALEKPPAPALQRTLHTHGRFARQAEIDGFVVRLEEVKPYPKDGVAIAPDDYRATVVVTRR